jgi:hypothetical protein
MAAEDAHRQHLVKLARQLERTLVRRRQVVKQLRELDDTVRLLRSQVRQLTMPDPADVYCPPLDQDNAG